MAIYTPLVSLMGQRTSIQVLATPMSGWRKSLSVRPVARSMARAGARLVFTAHSIPLSMAESSGPPEVSGAYVEALRAARPAIAGFIEAAEAGFVAGGRREVAADQAKMRLAFSIGLRAARDQVVHPGAATLRGPRERIENEQGQS